MKRVEISDNDTIIGLELDESRRCYAVINHSMLRLALKVSKWINIMDALTQFIFSKEDE